MKVGPGDIKPQIKHDKKDLLKILHAELPTVQDYMEKAQLRNTNKYTELALSRGFTNYRICTTLEINRLRLYASFTDPQKEFFAENGEFLVVFNTIGGKVVAMILRSLKTKQFIDVSDVYTIYGIDLLNDNFRYGDWLLITEGFYDADCFRFIYNNTIAMLTSNMSVMQSEVLSTITNRFIVALDSDESGKSGIERAQKRLKQVNSGCIIETLPLYSNDKDLGVMGEVKSRSELLDREEYYAAWIRNIISSV